jgi:outer membrane protein assembly factor BamB
MRGHGRTAACVSLGLGAAAACADWTGWRGPFCNGTAADSGLPLVETWEQARLLWRSDERVPGTYEGDARGGGSRLAGRVPSGYCSPVVAEGRVFLVYYVPNGPVYDASVVERGVPKGGFGREHWYTDADEVVLCADANTGKTLWKRVVVERGWNLEAGFNKGGCQLTPCYGNGVLYALNTSGRVYAFEGKTGAPVWESDLGIRARYQEMFKEGSRETGRIEGGRNDFAGCVMLAGGVLAASDHWEYKGGPRTMANGNGLVGFDARSGRRLWRLPGLGGGGMLAATPLRWTHGGREYFIASGERGVACVDPLSGRELWNLAGANFDNAAACDETRLFCSVRDAGLGCYEITPQGASLKWKLPRGEDAGFTSPVLYRGHLYGKVGSGRAVCIEANTGKVLGTQAQEDISGSMVGGDGLLFAHASGRGKEGLNVFRMDPADFRLVGGRRWPVSFANSTTPAYVEGRLYLRGRDRLYCYDLRAVPAKQGTAAQ